MIIIIKVENNIRTYYWDYHTDLIHMCVELVTRAFLSYYSLICHSESGVSFDSIIAKIAIASLS